MNWGKRTAAAAAFLLFIAFGATACGTVKENAESGTADAGEKAEAGTRIVHTVKGDVEIPANPQRVVAGYYHGTLIAIGMKPIGAGKEWWMGSPFLKEQEADIEDIGSPLSLEKVASLRPDLIVINDTNEADYDSLTKIAPTVLIPYDSKVTVREEVKRFGQLFGREKEAQQWQDDYDAKAEAARKKLEGIVPAGATATIVHPNGPELAILGDNYGRGGEAIYHALGFAPPEIVRKEVIDSGLQYDPISMELLPEFAGGDYVFLCAWDGTSEQELKALTDNPLWNNLPAVKAGRLIVLDYKTYFYFDPVSVVGQITALADQLAGQLG